MFKSQYLLSLSNQFIPLKRLSPISIFLLGIILLAGNKLCAQLTACPNGLMYSQTSPIQAYNPNLPLSTSNPYTIAVTGSGSGLAYGPNFNAASPSPTFYSIIGGNYAYWNGTGWTNTGHATGNTSAVNIASGPGCLYNLVGGTGQIYVYNGTGPGTLLTTVAGFSGGGPYDLVVDNCCNFYVFKATAPQSLSAYSPTGVLLGSCTVSGMPTTSSGIGFAIIGNKVVVVNGSGMFVGTVTGSAVSFTNVTSIPNGGDVASCPIACGMCYSVLPLNFKSFSCNSSGIQNILNWETALEEGVSAFKIERSTDAENFETIATITPNHYPSKYTFTDNNPVERLINYYRINGIENFKTEGTRTDICYAKAGASAISVSSVYPNPTDNYFSFNINSNEVSSVNIRIYDSYGKIVKNSTKELQAGAAKIELNLDELSPGIYSLEISGSNNHDTYIQKLVKLK